MGERGQRQPGAQILHVWIPEGSGSFVINEGLNADYGLMMWWVNDVKSL